MRRIFDYDLIALDYMNKRQKPWIPFLKFLDLIHNQYHFSDIINGICIDLGCGSGRNTEIIEKYSSIYLGIDSSFNMLLISKFKEILFLKSGKHKIFGDFNSLDLNNFQESNVHRNYICSTITNLPLRNRSIDSITSIATLHHILPLKILRKSLLDIKRILKHNKFLIITLWSKYGAKLTNKIKKINFNVRMKKNMNHFPFKSLRINSIKDYKYYMLLKSNPIKLKFYYNIYNVSWKVKKSDSQELVIYRPYFFFTFNKIQIFKRYFEIKLVKVIQISSGERNYFLLLKNTH